MAYWNRYYGRKRWRYRKYRRFYKRYRRSYARRYVNASSRSSIRCKCVVTGTGSLHSGYENTLGSDVFRIIPLGTTSATNPVTLVSSPLFVAYQNLYEEMKIIGYRVTVSVNDQIGNSTLPSLQIYTAWDRRHGYGEADLTPTEVKNAATSNVATALNNNVAKLSRSIYASDLIEKAQWMDSTAAPAGNIASWVTAGANPNMFCPAFYMCFGSPALNVNTQVANVKFSVSVTYYVAFRNPRFGGSSSSKDLPAKEVTWPVEDDDDDGDDMVIEDPSYPVIDESTRIASAPPASRLDREPVTSTEDADTSRSARRKKNRPRVLQVPKNV